MNFYDVLLILFLAIIVYGIVKGYGDNRSIIVFKDYDDLGLTFLVPASFFLILYIFSMLGGTLIIGMLVSGTVALWLLVKLARNTYFDNGENLSKTLLALVTKIPLAIIWIFNLIQILNPSGNSTQRRSNRGQALLILTFLTPIVGMLVVDKSGSYFNPKSWISGRRVGGGIRNNL